MMNMSLLQELARDMLKTSLKYNLFDRYVTSIGTYSISIDDGYGGKLECISVKMEAIYEYYKNNPESNIDQKFYDNLLEYTYKAKTLWPLVSMLRMIEYQILSEKEGRAPFKMDNDALLDNIKRNLNDNKTLYESEIYKKDKFLNIMGDYNKNLNEKVGRGIM